MSTHGLLATGPPATQPRFLFFIKIAIIVLSIIVLALAAYAISLFGSYSGYYGGYAGSAGYLIFAVIWSWIVYGVFLFFELRMHHLFYRIAAIVLWSLSIIFWLSAWAWSASIASFWLSYDYADWGRGLWHKEGGALAGCAAIGAIIWILTIVHLVFFVLACLRDTSSTSATHNQAELGHVSHKEPQSNVTPAAPVQNQYETQPVYGQQQQTQPVYNHQA